MNPNISEIKNKLKDCGLKITPQRISILVAVYSLNNHPTVENIAEYVRRSHPGIATGTVYKVLETLLENRLVKKVTSGNGSMRYDGMLESHHHLYCEKDETISDYVDPELDNIIKSYFDEKKIPGFKIEDFTLQIKGKFES